ncbi:ATP-dependent RNA helicase DDX42 [Schistosoma japonicum]|nr:ATP-dependent RNA helicase DDX42 [Schistosoma japonicum]KAH8849394.1 ATP-dependent RNA helicase DDX42 [Schistosoma japonicum]KAH8849395.1 ATP-dependent RNA helicase DDX42 [Schistosoma japonicum]KAH8849396.1 ATP-dependent RNA helicase DDX42 [Schistosoma japonicum]KAH8849398.1 ATP-dependent RNA helicase DDX42 [Schistosoma japonicum]
MSHSRRGGRWGVNFISGSGPQHSLSTHSVFNDDNTDVHGQSGDYKNTKPSNFVRAGGASVPPPPSLSSRNSKGYSDPNEILINHTAFTGTQGSGSTRAFANLGRKRVTDEDDYFLEDDDTNNLEYQPAPGSPAAVKRSNQADAHSDDSDDPLDQFMAGINEEVRTLHSGEKTINKESSKAKKNAKGDGKGVRDDIEQEDEIESYLRFMEENPHLGLAGDDEEEVYEYDADGNIIGTEKKAIDPLPPVDHSMINYAPFAKNFYVEHEEISSLDEAGVDSLRAKLGLRVSGPSPLRPVCSFAHLGLDEPLMEAIRKAGYTQPTPIQAQAVPLVLAGRDVIGIGKTGSGKTAAFLWPLIIHIMDQPELKLGDGPIGVICAPTRELALQIYSEAKKLAKVYNLTVVCAYGGGSLWEQQKACEAGCEILVCTPGRLIDIVKKKSTNLRRVTYLVFDEADKMFNLGFEPQVRSIANHVRPDRQTLLFSATFKRRLERLARDILLDPIRIVQGELGEANEDITQHVEIFDKIEQKWDWLTRNLVRLTTEGSVLIFVTRKVHSEEVAQKLKSRDLKVLLIHGDMHQSDRNTVIQAFKRQEAPILVATDVASRGLDIPSIHNVINYEVARDIDTHTHRIGRTGRAGAKGTAYTLFVAGKDPVDFAACLVQHLESSSQIVPQRLLDIALKCTWFANNRSSLNNGDGCIRPSGGFEPRQPRARPGLGLSSDNNDSSYYCPRSGPAAAAAAGEGAELIRPGGLQADRFSAMKAAFSAQYNRRFVSAGVEASRYTHPEMLKSSNATAVDKLQLTNNFITQSNLEELKNHSHQPKSEQQSQVKPQNVQTDSTKQKRSRWD